MTTSDQVIGAQPAHPDEDRGARAGVRRATDADRREIVELVREMIPGVDVRARLAWLYDGNPAGPALTWVAFEGNEVAGCTSLFPFRLRLDGENVLGALGGDGFVRPRFRRRGIGGQLHHAVRCGMDGIGIRCMYGAPGAMNVSPLKHGGAREVGQVARWVRPLRGAALGMRTSTYDQLLHGIPRPRVDASLDPMRRNDPRVDRVWGAIEPDLSVAATRDSRFYTWRFMDAPAGCERAYVIESQGKPIGMCALQDTNGGRSVRIVDLVTIPGLWHTALSAIAGAAARTDALTLDIELMARDGLRRQMWRGWFTERERKPFLRDVANRR